MNMNKATSIKVREESIIIYQACPEDSIPEPAILLQPYVDICSIEQGEMSININYETIPELIKQLKNIQKP